MRPIFSVPRLSSRRVFGVVFAAATLSLTACVATGPISGGSAAAPRGVVQGQCAGIGPLHVAFRPAAPACGIDAPVRMTFGPVDLSQTVTLDCRTAQAFDAFIQQTAIPASRQIMGRRLKTILTGPGYDCRNVYHRASGRLSEHARGRAIDISGFVFDDGSRVILARDWDRGGPAARFLRAIRDGGCRQFNAVLGPNYNAAHRDHFHFDLGGWRTCS